MKQKDMERKEWEINRRIKPQTTQDFHVLLQDIDIWHDTEVLAMKSNTCHEVCNRLDLLRKQIALLQAVDRLKRVALRSLQCDGTAAALQRLSDPKVWSLQRSSGLIKVYTQFNITAKKLQVLYRDLIKDSPSCEFLCFAILFCDCFFHYFHGFLFFIFVSSRS